MKVGGTTIWERWDALREDGTCNTGKDDGTGGMVSFNHYASGAVGDFLYRRIAGIEATEADTALSGSSADGRKSEMGKGKCQHSLWNSFQ